MSSRQTKGRKIAATHEVAPERGPQWWWYAAGLFLSLFAVFEIYQPSMRAPFLFDDLYLPFLGPGYAQATFAQWTAGVRPLLMTSYWLNFQLSQTEPYSYHVVNVLFHFANAVLVWLAVRRILEWAGVEAYPREVLSIFGGLLFLLHPVQTESVTYVASRSESQSLLFFMGAFALFLYRGTQAVSVRVSAGVLILFGCAVLTKEHTAVLPALFLLTDFYWNPGFSLEGIRKNWKLYAPISVGALLAGVFVMRVLSSAKSAGFGMEDLPWYQYFFTQCRAIWVYVRMFVVPVGLNVDHEFAVSRDIIDHGAIIGLLALIGLAAAAWIWRREYRLASYGYFAFLLLLAPTSSVVPIRDVLVERRLYLAFFPLVLICCEFLRRIRVTYAVQAALLLVVLAYAGGAYARNQVWSDAISLWKDTVEKSPSKQRPHFQLAFAYFQEQKCADAVREYEKTAQLGKPDYSLYVDWGHACECAGQPDQALEKFERALTIEKTAHAYTLIAMVHAKRNEREAALSALDQAEKLDPNFATTYIYRGNLLLLSRDFDLAAQQFQKALALTPTDVNARNGLDLAQRRVVPNVR